jgi:hypothetical protein
MSRTAASTESIRTQASIQSSRPSMTWGLVRTLMSGSRPSSAASRRPRGDSRTRARPPVEAAGGWLRRGAVAGAWAALAGSRCAPAGCRCAAIGRSLRNPSSSWNPPWLPRTAYTGIPAALNASMSRRIVRSDTSSSLASCPAVIRPRACSRPSNPTSRLARTGQR